MQTREKRLNKKSIVLITCILFIIIIQIIVSSSHSIEGWYSTQIYPTIGNTLRIITGWLPISVGDIGYIVLILFFVYRFIKFLNKLFKKQITKLGCIRNFFFYTIFFSILYIVFYSFWGLNYYRKGIAYQLKIERSNYSDDDLLSLTQNLATKAGEYRHELPQNISNALLTKQELFSLAKASYDSVEKEYPFLKFTHRSTKASIFGGLGNYLGYTGYYNPFSGEAQINMHSPFIVLPAVVCHEMAHQLGYATEDEANFVGYLAASHSFNKIFQYATYLDLYQYASSELFVRDSNKYNIVVKNLDTLVRKDIIDIRNFYRPYRTRMRKIINTIYGQYLKANNQPQGIDTYSDVISLLISYRKKYNKL